MKDKPRYNIPKERGRWRALLLAGLMHVALFAMLWIGVNWQSEPPGTIEAEVWSLQPQAAAPRPEPRPEPPPEPEQKIEPPPTPIVKAPPRAEPPPPEPEVKAEVKPDIALEQERKRREEEARKKAEEEKKRKEEDERRKAEEERRKAEEERVRKEEEARKKADEEKKRAEEARRKAEEEKKRKEEEARRKAEAEKKRKEREAAEEAAREKAREDELDRLRTAVGSGGSGQAARSQGSTDAGYAGKIRALIISNTVFNVPPTLAGNPAVEYAVELLPDGTLRNTPRKLKSSGVPGFDEAVLRAIQKSQPFPPDSKGVIPSSITISHQPKDQ